MGSIGSLSFMLITLTTLAGIAAAPWLLNRVAATPGVYVARKSLGWATVLFGVLMLTLASVGVLRVTVNECVHLELPAAPDPIPFPEHVVIDYSRFDKKVVEKKAKLLKAKAEARGWLFQNSSAF